MKRNYRKEAKLNYEDWVKCALPIGYGEMGAKIFGAVKEDCIQINHKSL